MPVAAGGLDLVQLAFLREVSLFHPLYAGVGLVLVWLGVRESLARAARGRR